MRGPNKWGPLLTRIRVIFDDIVKLLDQSGAFFVCEIKVHGPDMGLRSLCAKAGVVS